MVVAPLYADPPAKSEAQTLARIRAQVNAADTREKSYRKVERNLVGQSTEGGVLTGWFDGNTFVKMTARYFGEEGKGSSEFYLQNNKPIFVLDTDYKYDRQLSGKVTQIDQKRFYWNADGKLVRVLDDKKRPMKLTDAEVQRHAKGLVATVPEFIALLRAPAKGTPDDR